MSQLQVIFWFRICWITFNSRWEQILQPVLVQLRKRTRHIKRLFINQSNHHLSSTWSIWCTTVVLRKYHKMESLRIITWRLLLVLIVISVINSTLTTNRLKEVFLKFKVAWSLTKATCNNFYSCLITIINRRQQLTTSLTTCDSNTPTRVPWYSQGSPYHPCRQSQRQIIPFSVMNKESIWYSLLTWRAE